MYFFSPEDDFEEKKQSLKHDSNEICSLEKVWHQAKPSSLFLEGD